MGCLFGTENSVRYNAVSVKNWDSLYMRHINWDIYMRYWASTVLFVFCVLKSKLKDIPSKLQKDHCEWIFRLVWFPQSWSYMFKPMTNNSNKAPQQALHVELRRLEVDIMLIRQRPNFDEFPRHFHLLFWCSFSDRKISERKIHLASTYFVWCNFDGRKIYVVSTYFFWCNSLVEISTVFLLTFFDVILMVEKSSLFARTFFDEISMVNNSKSVLVSCRLTETFEGFFIC